MYWGSIINTSGYGITLLSDLNILENLTGTNLTIDGLYNTYLSGNLTIVSLISGTSTIILTGTGTWTGGNASINITINTSGTVTISGTVTYTTGTLTYINGKVITKGSTLNLTSTSTLINCHKINFNNIVITAGTTITMNEFFNGSPGLKTNISSTTTSNYTIAFQDGFEKIAKFVNIDNCTLSKPQQLLVITNSPKSSTNTRGIRYINQSPNGIAKGDASVANTMTFGTSGILSDPNMR